MTTATRPTYGNFRRPTSAGIGPFGLLGTVLIFAGILGLIMLMVTRAWPLIIVWVPTVLILLALLAARDRFERPALVRIANRVAWWRRKANLDHLYRAGPLGRVDSGKYQLPGILAASQLTEHTDSYGRPFAILHIPATGHYATTFSATPDGAALVDPETVDTWVAEWGAWLGQLSQEAGVVAASVTVETSPDTGARLRREVAGRMVADAPALARSMLEQVLVDYPTGSASTRVWVTLTFAGRTYTGRKRTIDEIARDLGARLPTLTQQLAAAGAGACRPVSAATLCEIVRTAYDPASSTIFDDVRDDGSDPSIAWDQVGPAATEASWDTYRHDSAISQTWVMATAPRSDVANDVLKRLLDPHPDVSRKRVTIIYRPLHAGKSAQLVEQDKRNADFRVVSAKRPSARALRAQISADATAREEARGAALVDFGLLITATVADESALPDARAAIENLVASARLVCRPAHGAQDSAFAACLPLGLVLQSHMRVPYELRKAL